MFSTPDGNQAYQTNFLDLALLTSDVGSLLLDGSSVSASDCTVLRATLYSTCNIGISPGAGIISDAGLRDAPPALPGAFLSLTFTPHAPKLPARL